MDEILRRRSQQECIGKQVEIEIGIGVVAEPVRGSGLAEYAERRSLDRLRREGWIIGHALGAVGSVKAEFGGIAERIAIGERGRPDRAPVDEADVIMFLEIVERQLPVGVDVIDIFGEGGGTAVGTALELFGQGTQERAQALFRLAVEIDEHQSAGDSFALDGWPIYGPVGWKDTNRTSKLLKSSYTGVNDTYGNPSYVAASGDLDDCNGLISPTPDYPEGTYHYVMSLEANTDGTVKREISPYFGYDIRNTLNKHGLMPSSWTNDTTYANALQAGFTINGVNIPGTDSPSFTTFYQFIVNMRTVMSANGMSTIANEFETMKISYPFTIRKYRGTPANSSGGGGVTGNSGVTAISPSSGARGQSYSITITLQALAGTPGLPPLTAPITTATVGGTALTSPSRASTNTVTGTLTLPANTATGAKDIVVTFQGQPGQPGPSYTGTGLFMVTDSSP